MTYNNVIVTGASRGLGYELVRQILQLSPAPKNVIATTRTASDKLNQLKSQHSNLHILHYDATNYDSYPELVKQIEKVVSKDGVDLLINNAGIALRNDLETVTPKDFLQNIEVNTVGPFTLTQSLLPLLRKSAATGQRTIIVNVSSGLGSITEYKESKSYPSYRASKAALNMLSKMLAVELKKEGIIVLAVCPGWVKTDMGGENAEFTPETSIKGILEVIEHIDIEQTGAYKNHDGKSYGW